VKDTPVGYAPIAMQRNPRLRDARIESDLDRDGFVVVDDVLDSTEMAHLAEVFRTHDSPLHQAAFSASILSDDVAYRQAVDREIRAVLQSHSDALFHDYRLCFSNFSIKHPQTPPPAGAPAVGSTGEVLLHQDITFVDESRYQSLALWCPLVDTHPGNGCLYAVPGSHRWNTGPRGPGTPYPYRALDSAVQKQLKAIPMRAGSAFIFCQKLFHASPPNTSGATRVVVTGLAVPREAQLLCCYPAPDSPARLEVYAVDDAFYSHYIYRSRPTGVPRIGTIDFYHDPLGPGQLHE